jgi:hypothetical protein
VAVLRIAGQRQHAEDKPVAVGGGDCGPIRSRQRVTELGSIGNWCCK